ncbi:anthranilate phosphoribosyltransferase [Planotetraspora silvatica]|uniref:Anthranilate phosphoribosyltransferase n=1 Tax=Planotetraspora silvatica TaxID=234614 RepID=A0A8J3ULV3_9ACTN|nr:anthranilate phosphoribosyltransferase [Planotetraspora silvatica]GII47402.1 anthranilate phosphoribosyltransferase [Planotetraspora silvatica]
MTEPARSWPHLLATLLRGQDLTADDTRWAMRRVMDDAADPAQLAGFLVALRAKGESTAELRGMLDALMERVVPLPVDGADVVDIVGTGGDGAHTVNVSTMAAIVVAAAGVPVVKNGGRSVSSKAGSADVLEALGLSLDLTPDDIARCLREVGIGFTFAPRFHHGLRHAGPVRKALGVPTAINYLAPLTNPASPRAALVGCSNSALAPVLASVLAERGASALVVRGQDGLDEITTAAPTDVWIANGDGVRRESLNAAGFGLARSTPEALRGGDAAYNASAVHRVLAGEPGAARDAVLANAAGALAAHRGLGGGLHEAFATGLDEARHAIDSGAAATTLENWLKLASSLADRRR